MVKNKRGKLIVISGPSGAGKSTVIGKVMARRSDLCFSVSVTTRPPRDGEMHGRDYFFITRERFAEMADSAELLEYAEYVGNCYGTPRDYVEDKLASGVSVVLDIEVQGAAQVRSNDPSAIMIFIIPPCASELESRLRRRKTDPEEKIRHRLLQAKNECAEAHNYDYIVINDDPDAAANELDSIITAEKCRAAERLNLITEVLLS
ncbi:MAG: guanylate kinase [Oscillospiraceae bacterium]